MPEQSGGFLARSGLDSIRIAGHKVPIALLAGLVALIGVVAILRARQQGRQVAVGASPATAADSGFGLSLPSSDPGPALANISQQLTNLAQGINGPSGTGASTAPRVTAGSSFWSTGLIPIYPADTANQHGLLQQIQVGGIPVGALLNVKGPPQQVPAPWGGGFLTLVPVDYLGGTALVSSTDITPI
jgi:hypothetical protein